MADNHKRAKTGYKGVYKLPGNRVKPYQAVMQFKLRDKRYFIHLGYFDSAEEGNTYRVNYIENLK